MDTNLAVLEGKWFKDKNTSIKSVVDLIGDLQYENPHCYYYEMFCNAGAIQSIIDRVCRMDKIRLVYIAAHGSKNGIQGTDQDPTSIISAKQLINCFKRLKSPLPGKQNGKHIDGVFFGSCEFMTENTAAAFLNRENSNLQWIAGYCETVDWIKSTVCDLFFWNTYLLNHHNEEDETTVREAIGITADEINSFMPGAYNLGMRIYRRKHGGGGGIEQLIKDPN